VIDDDVSNLFVVNEYYKSIDNTYKKGQIEYPLYDLTIGLHKLTLKVWDVNNNSMEQDIWINVADKGQVIAYPNPFTDFVTFLVDQPRLDISGEIEIKIHDCFGHEVWSQVSGFDSFTSVIDDVVWYGDSPNGEKMSSGLYFVTSEIRYEDNVGNITEKSKVILQN